MKRRHFTFSNGTHSLAATLDVGDATTGLLIISGGNEVRSGAFGCQSALAAKIATQGYPVLRFDRSGIGDSEGDNASYQAADDDITSALAAFRKQVPQLKQIVAFGNCDAATALALRGGKGCHALILANPWTFEEDTEAGDALPPPEAIRSRYAAKLRNPREWVRLVKGEIDLGKLARGIKGAAQKPIPPSSLAEKIAHGINGFEGETTILLAGRDRTAQAFAANWDADDPRLRVLPEADHAFSSDEAQEWLTSAILEVLNKQAGQLDMR